MANIIKPKRSSVAGKVPTTSDIVNGEIAINSTDQKIYTNAGGTVTQVGAGVLDALGDVVLTSPTTGQSLSYNGTNWVNSSAGSGDVTGAASSTDNAVTRFDGTTGKAIQNSTVTLDDNGNFANVNAIGFDTTPGTLPTAAGSMYWDSGDGTPSVILNANTSLQLGQENIALVYNGTGSTIAKGSVVAVNGAQGQRPSVALADADSEALSAPTLGIAAEAIANGAEGFVATFGFIRGINTSGFTAGAPIYLSQTAGAFTQTRPSAPAHTVALGWVIKVNASSGEVFVNINNGWELDELHNVLITSPTSGNTLIYDAAVGVWKNANITAGTGISVTNGAGSITIANTGVTSVAMTVPTGLTISGSPITTSGTLALTFTAGYSIPTTASQTNWDTAYSDRLKWDGGSTGLVAATGRTSLGGTTVGQNFFTLTNPGAITFPRMNADNTVSSLNAADFRTAIGAGTGSGTVTSVATGTGLTGGTITSTGTISLANTAVTAGSYTNANITVDAQGRITSASNGSAGGVTSVSAGTGISVSASTGAVTITNTGAVYDAATSSTGYFDLPTGTDAQRPGTPATGMIRYNSTQTKYEVYLGGAWQFLLTAGYNYSGRYVVVAGGGGGGQGLGSSTYASAGGGAGGYRSSISGESSGGGASAESALTLVQGTTYTITVGAGGAFGSVGSNSVFSTITSTGGGSGRPDSSGQSPNGGSGGGGGDPVGTGGQAPGTGTSGQGYAGGNAPGGQGTAGGGGGASAAGSGAQGGNGVASSVTGTSVYRAGGGSGGTGSTTSGGLGGGGTGAVYDGATAGGTNTGGGGGGTQQNGNSTLQRGKAGGSGVVILQVPTTNYSGITTGSPTVSTVGSNTILVYNSSGTYTA